jgi:Na+-translocating ferredoxin:NAD+ oxidoreductase RNF subunit RnfB
MKICISLTVTILLIISLMGSALSAQADIFSRTISPAKNLLVFPNAKGEVIFSHSIHLMSLKENQCILCHRIENPTLEKIQSRFENHRVAHSFCKGCHRDLGKGPTECHQCHNYKITT